MAPIAVFNYHLLKLLKPLEYIDLKQLISFLFFPLLVPFLLPYSTEFNMVTFLYKKKSH